MYKISEMSIAPKCICELNSGFCIGGPACKMPGKSLQDFFIENNCTDNERNQLKAFLFVLRHPNINWDALENVIKKYQSIILIP